MEPVVWLTLGYQVPAEPSRNRVYVWRKLKELGAVYFRPGVALLPKSRQNHVEFTKLAKRIVDIGGEATLAELRYLDPADEQRTIAEFTARSHEEYRQLLEDVSLLRKNPSESRDAQRILRKYRQVQKRDYFFSRRRPELSRALADLFADISHATDDLSQHLLQLLRDKDK